MLTGRQITVLGAGIGGLATALAAARAGAEVTIIEQSDAVSEVGAGIQISPNGWRVLQTLGVSDRVAASSPRATAVRLRDFRRGAEVFVLPLNNAATPYHLVHRSDLIGTLEQACHAAGVGLRLDTRVTSVEVTPTATLLSLADGTRETHGLTLAADGLHSPARLALNPTSRPFFTGQVAWRCLVPVDAPQPPEAHVFMGPGRHLVRYPLRDRRVVNVVAVEERDAWAEEGWNHRDDPANLRRAFTDFAPEIRGLLDRARDPFVWGLFRHPVAATWHDGQLALLGDAAHPTLPFLAQGANMALEDAYTLVSCLAADRDTGAAFARYQGARRHRTMRVTDAATDNAKNYHLRPGPARAAAHLALRTAARVAPQAVTRRLDWIYNHDVTA